MSNPLAKPHSDDLLTLPTIADVERDVGISKDALRVWERRYGFPVPLRDNNGERRYTTDQIQRLRLIRRLMDSGLRPSKLMLATPEELEAQLGSCSAPEHADPAVALIVTELFDLSRSRQFVALRSALSQTLARQGLHRFIIEIMPGLLERVGDGWLRAEIGIAEEHVLTEALQGLLRSAIYALPQHAVHHPSVLLTSLPEEDHGLGLLMVEALLESEHATCLPLGLRTPLPDIVAACAWGQIDIVAISISAASPPRRALQGVVSLRGLLPDTVQLWAGGAGAVTHAEALRTLPNTRIIRHIRDTLAELSQWRDSPPAT